MPLVGLRCRPHGHRVPQEVVNRCGATMDRPGAEVKNATGSTEAVRKPTSRRGVGSLAPRTLRGGAPERGQVSRSRELKVAAREGHKRAGCEEASTESNPTCLAGSKRGWICRMLHGPC